MPLGAPLSEREAETFMAYLETLIASDGVEPEGVRGDGRAHPDQWIVTTCASGGTCD
jgi:hypothetical protein